MKNQIVFLYFIFATIAYGQKQNSKYSELHLDSIFNGSKGTFVLYDLQNDNYQVYNPERAKQKFAVHSTSKILWSIIGLEKGLIANETDIVKWDSVQYPAGQWWPVGSKQDQTIVTALKYSVNWYYMELLKLMTPELIEKYLNDFDYQKGFQVEKIHYFALTFNIKKSAFEQIEFLKGIYLSKFKISDKTLDIIKKGMLYESKPGCVVYTKTGTGPIANDNGIGWLIGWVEKGAKTWFFAFNVEDEDELKVGKLRYEYGFRVLKAVDLIE